MTEDAAKLGLVLTEGAKDTILKNNEPSAMAAGIDDDGKISLITIVLAVPNLTNQQATGMAVKAIRSAGHSTSFNATGMLFPITLTEQGRKTDALYLCLETKDGWAEDSIITYKKNFFGRWKFDAPRNQKAEARVFGPRGDELIALLGEASEEISFE